VGTFFCLRHHYKLPSSVYYLQDILILDVTSLVADIMEKELGLSFIPMDFDAVAEGYLP